VLPRCQLQPTKRTMQGWRSLRSSVTSFTNSCTWSGSRSSSSRSSFTATMRGRPSMDGRCSEPPGVVGLLGSVSGSSSAC
jgi:hypothetical protein